MQASAYLGDLGGLTAHRSLIVLDLRGTGESAAPADPATYRCDRLVGDVEALLLACSTPVLTQTAWAVSP
jgi:pimeloyl-ACP methyl ester carboxylesterase